VTFDGAAIPPQPFGDDDGSVDPGVAQALLRLAAGEPLDLVEVLRGTRLLIPLVAVLDSSEDGVEKDSHLATPHLVGADGVRANLAFTSVDAARAWDPTVRVVPATAVDTAAAALGDGARALVLDVAAGGAATLGVEALHRLAGRRAPVPDLTAAVGRALVELGRALAWDLVAGPDGVPVLLLELPDADPVPVLQRLAGLLGNAPEVRDRCPVGLDFAVPDRWAAPSG